jgi:hypothetical protein
MDRRRGHRTMARDRAALPHEPLAACDIAPRAPHGSRSRPLSPLLSMNAVHVNQRAESSRSTDRCIGPPAQCGQP